MTPGHHGDSQSGRVRCGCPGCVLIPQFIPLSIICGGDLQPLAIPMLANPVPFMYVHANSVCPCEACSTIRGRVVEKALQAVRLQPHGRLATARSNLWNTPPRRRCPAATPMRGSRSQLAKRDDTPQQPLFQSFPNPSGLDPPPQPALGSGSAAGLLLPAAPGSGPGSLARAA
jgi:hypothetical protein